MSAPPTETPEKEQLKTYCKTTATYINKLDLTETMSREQMLGEGMTTQVSPYSYRVGSLALAMDHAAFCTNRRCCRGFCFSLKGILKHYADCYHLGCLECHRFNPVVFEHVLFCEDNRNCRIPGCLSIARATGRIMETASELLQVFVGFEGEKLGHG
ncbi:hypothetical protein CRE_19899 [Caenorhabditis remanei]|uniref:TAZ-type domain-containing protein n=1 Tax=Caenorhabditis remanei TaxID=31234 RepID=E3N313_CAERE|nr:hypothetical protein CRE_19899 [Caenorhabditis remanei]